METPTNQTPTTDTQSERPLLPGIHHVTALASDPQRNVDFYTGVLGLRLIKQTINFDAPNVYHLYYGDDLGRPGTVMTFFPFPDAAPGRVGAGQVSATAWSIPTSATGYWTARLAEHGLAVRTETRFGEHVLCFADPDGLPLELVTHPGADGRAGWTDGPVPAEHAVRGFHGATLLVREAGPTVELLTDALGLRHVATEGRRARYAMGAGGPGALVDVLALPDAPHGIGSAGTVHHIAWRTPDDARQLAWQALLMERGAGVTDVRDREYFRAIYFREPGGILFEIATDTPGFAVDEPVDELGTSLKLPPWFEANRAAIEAGLLPLRVPTPARG